MDSLSQASAKKKTKRLRGFKFRNFIGCFQVTSWEGVNIYTIRSLLFFVILNSVLFSLLCVWKFEKKGVRAMPRGGIRNKV